MHSHELVLQLTRLLPHLLFDACGTESAMPLHLLQSGAVVTEISPVTLCVATNQSVSTRFERFEPADEVLEQMLEWGASDLVVAQYARNLVSLLKSGVQNVHLAIVRTTTNSALRDVFVVGLSDDHHLVGFRTQVVWT